MTNAEFVAFIRKNVVCVSCVLVSVVIAVVLYLRSDLLPEAEAVLAEKSQQGELIAANLEDARQLVEQHAAIAAANQAIAARMIRVGQLAENMQYFYKLENDTGTKLTDPRQVPWTPPPKNLPKTTYTSVGFQITAQGNYGQIVDLLRRLENGEHYCRVITCNIHPATETMRGTPLTITMSLELLGIQ